MANLIITQVPLGLRILTDTSDAVFNEFSVKRNNLSTDEIEIISDNKNNYAAFKIDYSIYTAVSFDGNVVSSVDELYNYLINVVAYASSGSVDESTRAILVVDYSHHEKHEGDDYFVVYSVASLDALTGDIMTLTFTTPNTTKWSHFTFRMTGTGGWRIRLIEAPTGGMATPAGTLAIYNSNRNSLNVSTFKDIGATAGLVSYNATLATGGNTLWDEYMSGSSGPRAGGEQGGHQEEIILKQNTTYQLSMYGADANPGTLKIGWYEHTNK